MPCKLGMVQVFAMTDPTRIGTERIEFDDLVLRTILPCDVDSGALAWCREKETMRHLSRRVVRARESLHEWVKQFDGVERILLGIFDRSQRPLGHVEFKLSRANRRATFTIVVGDRTQQRRGIAKKTILVATAFAFRNLDTHKVVARIFSSNTLSLHLFRSLGFEEEGVLRDHYVTASDGLQSIHCFALFATPENLRRVRPADEINEDFTATPQIVYRVFRDIEDRACHNGSVRTQPAQGQSLGLRISP